MAISTTVRKGSSYTKTTNGYEKQCPYATDIYMNDGSTVQSKITSLAEELNSNLKFEAGTMSMLGTPTGCTASVSGDYIKIGKMIFFQAEIRLNNNGTGATEVSIPCLPYPAKRHSTFTTGYQTCVIKTSAGNNYAVTKAGVYGDSRGLIFYTTQDGRTYTVKQNEIITSNTVIIVGGSYIAAD